MRSTTLAVLGLLAAGCSQQRARGVWDVQQVPLVLAPAPLGPPTPFEVETDEAEGSQDPNAELSPNLGGLAADEAAVGGGSYVGNAGHRRSARAGARLAVAHVVARPSKHR